MLAGVYGGCLICGVDAPTFTHSLRKMYCEMKSLILMMYMDMQRCFLHGTLLLATPCSGIEIQFYKINFTDPAYIRW